MTFVFVYGTLKKGFGNHGYLNRAQYIDEAVTNSREFTMFDGGFPFISDEIEDMDTNGSVVGELYEVTEPETLMSLDRLEGVPSLYVKKVVTVTTLSNLTYQAIMYVASKGSNERLKQQTPMHPAGKSKLLEWR